jgi:hypothetical protein
MAAVDPMKIMGIAVHMAKPAIAVATIRALRHCSALRDTNALVDTKHSDAIEKMTPICASL